MKRRFDWWREEMVRRHHTTFVCGNHRVWIDYDAARWRLLRGVQWPSYSDPVLDAFRLDPRLFAMVSAVQGTRDVKQIINQMHWKFPGSKTQWRYHQDKRSRRPAAAFRDLFTSYTNVGIAVEPFNAETGGMQVVPKSHLCRCDVGIEAVAAEMGISDLSPTAPTEAQLHEMLRRVGVDPAQLRTMDMAPGDVALWNPFLIHGGGLNTSRDCHRSFYIQGFVARDKGDRGHVAWLDGRRQPLGEPVLVHLEDFRETLAEGGRYYEQAGASSTREAKIQQGGGGGGGGGAAKQDDGAKAGGDDTEVHLVRD